METVLSSEASCFFKKIRQWTKSQKMKIVSLNFSCTVFSSLFTLDDLAMQALVWLCLVWFRVIWISAVSSALHMRI